MEHRAVVPNVVRTVGRPVEHVFGQPARPGKRGGRPCIRGMRITVFDVLSYFAAGMTTAEILEYRSYVDAELLEWWNDASDSTKSRARSILELGLHRLTRDHTYAQLLIDTGQLAPGDELHDAGLVEEQD